MSKIIRICDALDKHYGKREWTARQPVLDELILTILSQNTTAKNSKEAFARMRGRFCTWEDVQKARWEDIADAIRTGGLANQKAPRIKAILEDIYTQQGNLDLEWIAEIPDSEALRYLQEFHGVGRKTAACVLMFALNRPMLPVDTHVHRVAMRLGLIGNISAERAHDVLQEMLPPERIYSFHINMIAHGRQVCRAIRPVCPCCFLKGECRYFAEQARFG